MTKFPTAAGVVFLVAAVVVAPSAQPLSRLTGRVIGGVDAPVAGADVRIDAMFGFRGEDYVGQKVFTLKANPKGEWALIGFKAGIWMFAAWADGRLPDAIALPINISMAQSSGVGGDLPNWHPILRPMPIPDTPAGAVLREAADAAIAGKTQAMAAALARVADSNDPTVLIAAGRICLVGHDAPSARPFFRRALEREPQAFGGAIGMATTALLQQNIDTAVSELAEARKLTTDKDERSYITAAINDLNKVRVTWTRHG